MKSVLKKAIGFLVKRDWGWKVLRSTVFLSAEYAEHARKEFAPPPADEADPEIIKIVSKDLTVKNGPFKDLQYPQAFSFGSVIVPKLLGSYERELHPLIEQICQTPYTTIIDVGCAEGYYAVGLAFRNSKAKVYAYDLEPSARNFCAKMAEINHVSNRVTVGNFCSDDTLKTFSYEGRSLIFSDCEGYEKELFTPEVIPFLKNCDLLIELHDFLDINISTYISELFRDTHEQTFIESIDDIKRAKIYEYPELKGFSLEERKNILAENRPTMMEWVFLKAKSN